MMTQNYDWRSITKATRLGDQLYQRLAELIEQGEFAAGSRLPAESDLAERFGVSRPVIREALGRLRMMGVITSRKGSGSFVKARTDRAVEAPALGLRHVDSLAQVKQCFDFRVGLEGEAAYLAAQNRDAAVLLEMRTALKRIEDAIANGIVGMDADYEFHAAVAHASRNEFHISMMETMRTPIEFGINLGRSLSLRRPLDHLLRIHTEHVAIYMAIEVGDSEAARRAMRAHVADTCSRVFNGPDAERLMAQSAASETMDEVGSTPDKVAAPIEAAHSPQSA
jgi:DNA-binding FadR family transcriptional regulator